MKKQIKNLLNFKNLKVVITGTTGFKGSWLALWLLNKGAKVYGVSLKPKSDSILFKSLNLEKKIKQRYIDINNFNKINSFVKSVKPDIIFHLAAQSIVSEGFYKPMETFKTNIFGSINILETIRKNKVPNLVYVTSDKCYLPSDKIKVYKEKDRLGGNDNYSASKAGAEIIFNSYYNSYFKSKHLKFGSVRSGNVIGGGDFKKNRIIPDIIKSVFFNKKLILRNPNQIRPWQHVLDPLFGYLLLGNKLLTNELSGNVYPSWNFAPHFNCKYNVRILTDYVIKSLEIDKKIFIDKKKKLVKESDYLLINSSKAKHELKWNSRLNLKKSVDFTVKWYQNFFGKNSRDIYNFTLDQINKFEDLNK